MSSFSKEAFEAACDNASRIVDVRSAELFCDGFIHGTVSVPLHKDWLQSMALVCTEGESIVLITHEGGQEELTKLSADLPQKILGVFAPSREYLETLNDRGIIIPIEADEFAIDYRHDEFYLVDVRSSSEFEKLHVEDAENLPIDNLETSILELDDMINLYLYGTDTNEVVTAASIFKLCGFEKVRVVLGSFQNLCTTDVPFSGTNKKKVDIRPSAN